MYLKRWLPCTALNHKTVQTAECFFSFYWNLSSNTLLWHDLRLLILVRLIPTRTLIVTISLSVAHPLFLRSSRVCLLAVCLFIEDAPASPPSCLLHPPLLMLTTWLPRHWVHCSTDWPPAKRITASSLPSSRSPSPPLLLTWPFSVMCIRMCSVGCATM